MANNLPRKRRFPPWLAVLLLPLLLAVVGYALIAWKYPVLLTTQRQVRVKVADSQYGPVAGATIRVTGLRAQLDQASAYPNPLADQTFVTNDAGEAWVTYPKFVYEAMKTGQVILRVNHPDFVEYSDQGNAIDQPLMVILTAGLKLQFETVDSSSKQPITGLVAGQVPGSYATKWNRNSAGYVQSAPLDPLSTPVRLYSWSSDGPLLFSDAIDSTALPPGSSLHTVTFRPGREVVGRFSDQVPRPIVNGWVGVAVNYTTNSVPSADNSLLWMDYAPVESDGTFRLKNLPHEGSLAISGVCDGWVAARLPEKQLITVLPYITDPAHAKNVYERMSPAQLFPTPITREIVVEMEPAADCEILVVDEKDTPIAGASVSFSPNVIWPPGPGGIVGIYFSSQSAVQGENKDHPTMKLAKSYSAMTKENGVAIIKGLPARKANSFSVHHEQYELSPVDDRGNPYIRSQKVDLNANETTKIKVLLQRKGGKPLGASSRPLD